MTNSVRCFFVLRRGPRVRVPSCPARMELAMEARGLHPGSRGGVCICEAKKRARGPRTSECNEEVWGGLSGVGCVGWVCRGGNSFLNVCSSHHFLIFAKKTFLLVPLGWAKYVKPLQFPVSPPGRDRPLPDTITVRRPFGFFQTISLSFFRSPPGRFLFLAAFGQTRFLLLSLRRGGISF